MKNGKRIISVRIITTEDVDADTSYLGEYSNTRASEFSIDRAHSEDCASVRDDVRQAKQTLEHVQQTIGDLHNAVLVQYNGTLANEKLDLERNALDEAYNEVGELFESIDECDCGKHGDMGRDEYRYFNPPFNSVDKHGKLVDGNTAEEVRKYVRQDYDRMESLYAGHWCYIGIRAEAQYQITPHGPIQTLSSGGLWGIESNSDRSHIESIHQDELAELKNQLLALGFSKRSISIALKSIEEVNE